MASHQPDRIDTTSAAATASSSSGSTPASAALPTASSSAAGTPISPSIPESALARATSSASRFSKISQGTRRSRFVEALDHDDDIDVNYETGSFRGRPSSVFPADRRSVASSIAAPSIRARRRSRSSSLGVETPASATTGRGLPADNDALLGGEVPAAAAGGRRQVSFNFPLPPHSASSGPDTPAGTGTPTTPGYNERTGVSSNPFSDVYGADTPTKSRSTTSLIGEGYGGGGYEGERSKGGVGVDAKEGAPMPSPKLAYFFERNPQQGFVPTVACPARRHFFRTKWVTSSIILISIYATVVSGIFLVVALRGPEWTMIRSNGSLTPSNASLLTAILAKTIELSFGSSIIAFLGQVLSRRSLSVRGSGKGVTLAEMSMRNWIGSPGYMISNFETVRYALFSILGLMSFIAAIVATLYTSASDALVQPQLKLGALESKILKADIVTEFANHMYLGYKCETPIPIKEDETYRNATCLDISYAAQAYHDYQRFLSEWDFRAKNKSTGTEKENRVPGYSQYKSEIQVNGTWLDVTATEWNGHIINNVSLAMPHAGVLSASKDERNEILQPEELGGLGAYTLTASVPSPVIHVLCANMNRSELAPIVYTAWNYSEELDAPTWPEQIDFLSANSSVNSTVVDDLFGWGKNGQTAPIFSRFPAEYNTVLNQTFFYGRESIYLLGRDGDSDVERYSVCQLKASLTANCSTLYQAAQEGSSLSSRCDPEEDSMAYIHSDPGVASGSATVSLNWPWIGTEWANSLSLNAGISDGRASIARLLTQLIIKEPKLQTDRPSLAETLAVLAGSTLLMSTQDAQMDMSWSHDESILLTPETTNFNATIRERTYASGPTGEPQKLFFLVLAAAFVTNILCLAYFIFHRGLVTDFSEPPNLFSLAVNSPPAAAMAGSCGGGPAGPQWNCQWFIGESGGHLFVVPKEAVPAVVAARGNMGDAWRVEEEASWPVQHHDGGVTMLPDQHHQYYYGQLPGGSHAPLAISTATARAAAPGPDAGWMQKLKQRFSTGPAAYPGSPDTPSSATTPRRPGGPPASAWSSHRAFGATTEYMPALNPGGGTSSPDGGLYPVSTRGTAWTGASSAYEMGRVGTMGPQQQQQAGGGGSISRAYSKLSRKKTFL
ncbi:hypothetical protein GTA08_BOTSDO00445 [Neofusicoccum parvum]|uniref:Uncharacterized protein n=1 Tax=Neofusicoccum parvum TaxID=310453 RepID=A0ACB5SLG2_9PEZI|nr:hypothetical protein GTA08_BOTSDO00445 [Neofusicoccum parvum]